MKSVFLLATLLFTTTLSAQNVSSISSDPPVNRKYPPEMIQIAVPSHGSQLLGVLYLASGPGPHPTVILFHGFPGYEQNLDLAQALRRDGYNVLAMHYRGSWGVTGRFSFANALEDADSQVNWITAPEITAKYRIDPTHLILIGHSVGGFMALAAAAHNPKVSAAILISAAPISHSFVTFKPEDRDRAIDLYTRNTNPANLLPLTGVTPADLGAEIFDHRKEWDFMTLAPTIGKRPVLLITADDGSGPDSEAVFQFLKHSGNIQSEHIEFETDHSFSDHRIALEETIITWLDKQRLQASAT
jgi:pimeloyl-ACP methyl ester carboxylesterase